MDAPPEAGEDVRPFVAIAKHLAGIGLSAPGIVEVDETVGLLLLEDLGDALFARVIAAEPAAAAPCYDAAIDVLVRLHDAPPPPGIERYDVPRMTAAASLAYDWYVAGIAGPPDPASVASFRATCAEALAPVSEGAVLALRDYHAENLIWLPDRSRAARVGLLDFQDALLGHPAYDVISLTTDARRDVGPDLTKRVTARYLDATGIDRDAFAHDAAILTVQRNLRILGVFARLARRYGRPKYVELIPRVWAHLRAGLDHPALGPLADRLAADLPPPTPDNLARLKETCQTAPML